MTRLAAALLLVLAGCSAEPEDARAPEDGAAPGASGSPTQASGEDAPGPRVVSHYTALDLDRCDEIERATEGEFVKWRCTGREGIPYWVMLADGRYDIDVGAEGSGGYSTLGAYNELDNTLEWRTRDGKSFAVIFRYRDVAMETPGRSVLAVEKIGRGGEPGCRVGHVAGDTEGADRRARELADSRAQAFRCDLDEPTFVGDAR